LIPVIAAVFFFSRDERTILPVFLISYIIFYLIWGMTAIFWREMIGRSLHPDKLTSAMGMRESISSVIGFLSGFLAMYILGRVMFPDNYLLLFIIAFGTLVLSYISLTGLKEATYNGTYQVNAGNHLRNIFQRPLHNKAFRWYAVFILFAYGTLFIGGLYTAVGIERFGTQIDADRLAGVINIITLVSVSVFAVILGRVYDRFGKFWAFLPVVLCAVFLPWWAFFCHNLYGYLAMFGAIGIMWNGWFLELSTELGFADPERRHETIAFMALVKLIPIVIFTNLGGFLAETYSPQVTFVVSSGCCLIGWLVLVIKVRPLWRQGGE
jgi:hypothetical protein